MVMEQKNKVLAIGRRKEAVARVYIQPGTGSTLVNGRELVDYLGREVLVMQVREPLEVTDSSSRLAPGSSGWCFWVGSSTAPPSRSRYR